MPGSTAVYAHPSARARVRGGRAARPGLPRTPPASVDFTDVWLTCGCWHESDPAISPHGLSFCAITTDSNDFHTCFLQAAEVKRQRSENDEIEDELGETRARVQTLERAAERVSPVLPSCRAVVRTGCSVLTALWAAAAARALGARGSRRRGCAPAPVRAAAAAGGLRAAKRARAGARKRQVTSPFQVPARHGRAELRHTRLSPR